MGLLEKALEFKKEMNRKGQETLIDKIAGPADSEFITEEAPPLPPPDGGAVTDNDSASQQEVVSEEEAVSLDIEETGTESGEKIPGEEELEDISDDIYEIRTSDAELIEEEPNDEDELNSEDGAAVINDELFELPDDSDAETGLISEDDEGIGDPDFKLDEEEETDEEVALSSSEEIEDENPLGAEDEPVLPAGEKEGIEAVDEESIVDDYTSGEEETEIEEAVTGREISEEGGEAADYEEEPEDYEDDIGQGAESGSAVSIDEVLSEEREQPSEEDIFESEKISIDEVLKTPASRKKDEEKEEPDEEPSEPEVAEAPDREIPAVETEKKENISEKEKTIGKFLEDDDGIDEIVYSFDDFQDFPVLYEILKDISRADTKEELYDVILFSVNGQLGCSSSSVMIASMDDPNKWFVANSLGIEVREDLSFNADEGILKRLKRNIIDIDEYRDDPECTDQYDQFISIDTKLIAPIVFKKKALGALILGEKITGDEYTNEEFGLILSVCNASATLFNKVAMIERLNNENLGFKSDLDYSLHLNDLQDTILRNANMRSLEKNILKEFEYLWVEHFSVFIKNYRDETYIPFVVDSEDYLSLKENSFKIDGRNNFIDYVKGLEDGEKIEMFDKLDAVRAAFSKDIIKRMSVLWIYPFKVGNQLIGFIAVFKIRDKILEQEIDRHLRRYIKILFSSILSIREVDPEENRYIDNIEIISKRINGELLNAKQMNIPLTLVLMSIKNFKRYSNLYGYKEAVDLINRCVDIIRSKLADNDFSARIDRNKILMVLPGKDKKYAVPLANSLRNEIMQGFRKKEIQLLITFLMAEYPEDGAELQNLLDVID